MALPVDRKQPPLKIVLIEDDFPVRRVLGTLINLVAQRNNYRTAIFTSEDGVQGVGYISIINPHVIIIDGQLPQYSGREIVEFLTTNPKYAKEQKHVIVLQSEKDELPPLPANYLVLDKHRPDFIKQFMQTIGSRIFRSGNPGLTRTANFAARWLLTLAYWTERRYDSVRSAFLLLKPIHLLLWLIGQLLISSLLFLFQAAAGGYVDTNTEQYNTDLRRFRIRHYPSAITFISAVAFTLVQLGIFLVGALTVISRLVTPSYATWYNTDWTYRKAMVIGGSSAGAQTDYVMQIIVNYGSGTDTGKNVYCESHCKTDFGDVRFAGSDETTMLTYFMETKTDSTKAMFWVKIPSIPANPSSTTIYMYYGNNAASTASDPENTFLQFEGFESTPYDFDQGTASITQTSSGTAVSGSYVGRSNNAETILLLQQNDAQYTVDGHFFEGWVRYINNGANNANLAGGLHFAGTIGSTNGYDIIVDGRTSGSQNLTNPWIRENTSATGQNAGNYTTTNGVWYFLRGYRTGSTLSAELYQDLYGNPSTTNTRTSETTYSTGYTGVFAYSNNNADYDNFRVRKRANPEPSYNGWGGETTQSAVITVSASGNQTTTIYIPTTSAYVGGKFAISSSVPTSITSIKIREQGTVNATSGLDNIKLVYDLDTTAPYDCASESYAGSETQYGSTDTDGFDATNGNITYTGSASISTTSTMCAYVVLDVTSSATHGQTIEIDIANPSADVTALTGLVGPGTAVAISGTSTLEVPSWYNSAWLKRKQMTIQSAAMGSGTTDLTNFPLNINLTTDTNLAAWAKTNGDDILFTDQDGTTKLAHEIEIYTSSTGRLLAWVKIPTLRKTANTVIYMYYGNKDAANQQNDYLVWGDYKGVWHMQQNPAGSAPQILDSAIGRSHLTSAGSMTSGDSVSGILGNAVNFDGSNDALSVADPASGSLDVTTEDFSVETWIRTTSATSMQIFSKGAAGQPGYRAYLNSSFSSRPGIAIVGTTDTVDSTPGAYSHSLTNGSFHHLVLTFDRNGNLTVYIDGSQVTTLSIASVDGESLANSEIFYIARYSAGQYFNGDIDELRIRTGLLSSDWVSTAYNNLFLSTSFASEENEPNSGSAYIFSAGTQTSPIDFPSEEQYVGGMFVFRSMGSSTSVTGITLTESGTMNATYIDNMRLYYESDTSAPYDCTGATYGGTESQFGSTNANAFTASDGTAQVTSGGVSITTTSTLCVFAVFDFTAGLADDATMEIAIANPSSHVTLSSGSVTQTAAVAISGTTTMNSVVATWYNDSWTYRKRFVIQDEKVDGSGSHTDFPVLINLSTDSQLASNAQDDGDDIIFTASNGTTRLDHEIERFNGSTGNLVAWVRVPSLATTADTTIFMYYGNGLTSGQENVNTTWSTDYKGVWHLNTDPSGVTTIRNSANDTLDGDQQGGMSSSDLITGAIGYGYDFDGTDDRLVMGDQAYLDMGTSDFTLQAWIKLSSIDGVTKPVIMAKGAWGGDGYRFEVNEVTGRAHYRVDGSGGAVEANPGSYSSLANNTWRSVSISFDRDASATIYIDGVQQATASISTANSTVSNADNFFIGRNGGGNYWPTQIDEPRVRTGLLSSTWISTEYNNQSSPSTFYFLAGEEMTNVIPVISNVVLNSGNNITLTANTTTTISWTATVTDGNGYNDISTVTGKVYRTGLLGGSSCTNDTNNCYGGISCSLSGCSGTSCTATCSTNIQFHADPTDTGSTHAAESWRAQVASTDVGNTTGTGDSPNGVTEVNSLVSLDVSGNISYGTIFPGSDSGGVNQTITITNTGNVAIDAEFSGSALCLDYPTCSGTTVPVGNQEYSLSTFTYGSGTDLTSSATTVQLNLAKPTSAPSAQTINSYWGIAIPTGLLPGTYTGQNELVAKKD